MNDERRKDQRPPLQFGIRAVLTMTVAMAALFGVLRWLDVSAQAQYIVLAVLAASAIAAVALLIVIASSADDDL